MNYLWRWFLRVLIQQMMIASDSRELKTPSCQSHTSAFFAPFWIWHGKCDRRERQHDEEEEEEVYEGSVWEWDLSQCAALEKQEHSEQGRWYQITTVQPSTLDLFLQLSSIQLDEELHWHGKDMFTLSKQVWNKNREKST